VGLRGRVSGVGLVGRAEELLEFILVDRYRTILFFFFMGSFARMITWFFIPVDWNGDSYVHWQIAYLSLKIGFRRFRMWDLNGLEYYWGMIPHLVEAMIMGILGTTSILPYRVFNMLIGSFNVYLVYLVGRDLFYWKVGFFTAFFVAFFPIFTVFDIIAMQDTLALCFLILGFYYFRSKPLKSGIFLGLACQSRIEYWLVSFIFIISVGLLEKPRYRFLPILLGWLMVMVPFSIFFKIRTGNFIYPLWLNLRSALGGGLGGGSSGTLWKAFIAWILQRATRLFSDHLYFISSLPLLYAIGLMLHLVFRPQRRYYLYSFFASTIFINYIYVMEWVGTSLFWIVTRTLIPTLIFGFLILIKWLDSFKNNIIRLLPLIITLSIPITNPFILPEFQRYQQCTTNAFYIADRAMTYYKGGTIICDYQTMNYRFINKWHLKPTQILSNQYNPLYYGSNNSSDFIKWFKEHNVTVWIDDDWRQSKEVLNFIKQHIPQLLILKESIPYQYLSWIDGIEIYEVNQTLLEQT